MDDEDDRDEPRPRPRSRRRDDDDEEDEDDDRPRRRRRRAPDPMDDPAMRFVIPVNTSGLAIAAGYLGLISVLVIPAPLALILGIWALVHLKKHPKQHGHGRAIFAIAMGALFSLPIPFIAFAVLTK